MNEAYCLTPASSNIPSKDVVVRSSMYFQSKYPVIVGFVDQESVHSEELQQQNFETALFHVYTGYCKEAITDMLFKHFVQLHSLLDLSMMFPCQSLPCHDVSSNEFCPLISRWKVLLFEDSKPRQKKILCYGYEPASTSTGQNGCVHF